VRICLAVVVSGLFGVAGAGVLQAARNQQQPRPRWRMRRAVYPACGVCSLALPGCRLPGDRIASFDADLVQWFGEPTAGTGVSPEHNLRHAARTYSHPARKSPAAADGLLLIRAA